VSQPWSRSLFNGRAQVIVQATTNAGDLKLTASAEGLQPTAAAIKTVAGPLPPQVP
jgi:beta-galactosidase